MKKILAYCAFVSNVAMLGVLYPANASDEMFAIGTANVTGVYFPAGGAICRLFNANTRGEPVPHCVVESTDGSLTNLAAIRNGTLDAGITQSDWQFHAYQGSGDFAAVGPNRDLRAVFSLHSEPFTVVARKDSKITKFEDLKGKRLNIGNIGSGMRATMERVMQAYGWKHSDFSLMSELTAVQQGSALCNDQVDAIIYTAGHPNGAIQEVTSRCDTKLVDVTGPVIDKLMQSNPFYSYVKIPGGMYRGSPEDITTFGVRATLVTSAQQDSKTIYALVKSVFDNFDAFKSLHPVFSTLNKVDMVLDGNSAPLHEGAMRYYRQTGLYEKALSAKDAKSEVESTALSSQQKYQMAR
jgi:TRAP transporter TAXI family solute receptor